METIKKLHIDLMKCEFHKQFKIRPYLHNKNIINIHNDYANTLNDNLSYVLMHGRMGNGNDIIRYKKRGSSIVLLKYNSESLDKQEYLGSIPYNWINLNIDELKIEVDKYTSERKVFIPQFQCIKTYKQI